MLLEKEVLELGYTKEEMQNAPQFFMHHLELDAQFFKDFDVKQSYIILDDKLRKYHSYIMVEGIMVNVYKSSYYKGRYVVTTGQRLNAPSTYDAQKFEYKGTNVFKYNKAKIEQMIECAVQDEIYFRECVKTSTNAKDVAFELLKKQGFKMYQNNSNKAYLQTDLIDIEAEVMDNGKIYVQYKNAKSLDIENAEKVFKRLINA